MGLYDAIPNMINAVIDREGGFVDHPSDKGGATKYGITLGTLTTWRARLCTDSDIKQIERKEAYEIYYDSYFLRNNIIDLPLKLRHFMLDCAVNHGSKSAIKILQRELLANGYVILVDGICGNITQKLAGIAEDALGAQLLNSLVERRKQYYRAIVHNNPTQQVFIKGWLKRAESFRTEC